MTPAPGRADDDRATATAAPALDARPRPLRAVGPGPRPSAAVGPDAGATDDPARAGPQAALEAAEHLVIARTPEVAATDVWAEAGRKVIRFHLARMLTHVPAVLTGGDPDAVHDMRVAARRVRAAWRVFGDAYERPVVRRNVGGLRTLGSRLGAVRDTDVQLAILTAHQDRRSKRERAALGPLVDAWTTTRGERHRELVILLASPWFGALVADHESFVSTDGAGVHDPAPVVPATVRIRTASVTWDAYEGVWSFEAAGIGDADVATLHRLRIAAKWLRYTLEFVREPMAPASTELIRRVVVLQDHLGDIHDFHAAAGLARGAASTSIDLRPATRRAVERFAAVSDARVERLRRRTGPAWRGVAGPEYRRALGRAIARL